MPAPIAICNGYTAAGSLAINGGAARRLLLSEYSASFAQTLMQADGMMDFAGTAASVRRTKGAWVADVPTITSSLTFAPAPPILGELCDFIRTARNRPLGITLTDAAAEIQWKFPGCYLKEISFGGAEDEAASVSLDLFIPTDTVEYEWEDRELVKYAETPGLANGVGQEAFVHLIPYWAWDIKIEGMSRHDIVEFKFGFSQPIKPKFECRGADSLSQAAYLLFGLPEITFSDTAVLADAGGSDDPAAGTHMRTDADLLADKAIISLGINGYTTPPPSHAYGARRLLKMTGAYLTGNAPKLASPGEIPTVGHTWQIAGGLAVP